MRVHIWCDGSARPNGGPAGAGYVIVGPARILGSDPLGDATNNMAEYMAVRNALRAAADAGATSAYVRMDSSIVFGHLTRRSKARSAHLQLLKAEVDKQRARFPGGVTYALIPRERNGVADRLAKDAALISRERSRERQ
jgi:ribonuclease HI